MNSQTNSHKILDAEDFMNTDGIDLGKSEIAKNFFDDNLSSTKKWVFFFLMFQLSYLLRFRKMRMSQSMKSENMFLDLINQDQNQQNSSKKLTKSRKMSLKFRST